MSQTRRGIRRWTNYCRRMKILRLRDQQRVFDKYGRPNSSPTVNINFTAIT